MSEFVLKRSIPVEEGCDIVVAGAGPAGVAAAVSAARLGLKVLLADPLGCLGGLGTAGMVAAFGPMSDGVRRLARGFIGEVVDRLYERGWTGPGMNPDIWNKTYMKWTPYVPEGLKIVYDEFAQAAKVDVRFYTSVIDADMDPNDPKKVNGVIIYNVEGYRYIKAKAYVDCTGDGVLADLCKAEYKAAYRDTPAGLPITLASLWAGINWEIGEPHRAEHRQLLEKAIDEGRFTVSDRMFGGRGEPAGTVHLSKSTSYLNAGQIFKTNPLSNKAVSEALMWGRKQLLEYWDFMKKDFPGFENVELVASASMLGYRESRKIIGEEELTKEDFFAKRQFPNQIGVYNRFMDIHAYDASEEEHKNFMSRLDSKSDYQLGVGNYLGLPYGMLVPRGWKNLWVAGRCASCDNTVLGTVRAQPCCAIMGQAAGTAAAQGVKTGQEACKLDTEALRDTLRKQGVFIP